VVYGANRRTGELGETGPLRPYRSVVTSLFTPPMVSLLVHSASLHIWSLNFIPLHFTFGHSSFSPIVGMPSGGGDIVDFRDGVLCHIGSWACKSRKRRLL